jgi:NNP family nitrate/nitrite transporter-like MFS transporter
LIGIALVWMHFSVIFMDRKNMPELKGPRYLPELDAIRNENT